MQTVRPQDKRLIAFVWMFIICFSATTIAEDWPTYMHDNARTGVSSEPLVLNKFNSGWTYQSPVPPMRAWSDGPRWDAYSTGGAVPMRDFDTAFFVTVVGDNVYFGSSVTNSVHCLDISTGAQKWFYHTNGAVRFPPSHYDGKLYFGSDDGYVYCITASEGSLVWKYNPSASQRVLLNNGNLITQWPIRTGTAVQEGKVYFAASLVPWESTYLCAVDAATGSDSGSNLYKVSGGIAPNGAILASDQYLYLPQGRYSPHVFNRLTGASAGTLSSAAGTFALLTSDGSSTGIVFGSGKFSSWGSQLTGNNDKIASYPNGKYLVVADDTSYVVTETFSIETTRGYKYNYQAKLAALDRANGGAVKWDLNLDTRCFSIIHAGGMLFTGGIRQVQARSITDGSVLWSKPVHGRVRGLAAASGRLFVSTDTGRIYMFGSSSVSSDFDGNGTVDADDLFRLAGDYLKCTDPATPNCDNLNQ